MRARPSPLYGLGEVSRGSGSREPPGERLSHTWCRRRVILRHHMCVRERLSSHLLSHSPTGAPSSPGRPSATVGRFGALHLLVLQETQQSLPSFPEKEPSLIAGRLQIPRGRRLSPSTRADSFNGRLLLPSPSSTLRPQAATTIPQRQKHLSGESPRRNDEESPGP